MIEETATVISVDGDRIVVEAAVKSTCSGCHVKSDCGTGAIARVFSSKTQRLELASPIPVNKGDSVVIGISENGVVFASWLLYLLPILVLLLSLLVFSHFSNNSLHELLVFVLAIIPTWGCFLMVAKYCKRIEKGRFQPVLLRRLSGATFLS